MTFESRSRVTQGHWKRNHWIDHTPLTISRVILTFSIIVTLKCGLEVTQGNWKWYHLKACYGFLFAFHSNMAVSLAISQIFSIREWHDLEIWVWGRSGSFKMARFDRPCTTFYWSAIVIIALSCTIFELFDVE